MKERPIRLYAHEVRGIHKGRQTQIRRVVKLPIKDPLTGCEVAGCEAQSLLRQGEEICPYGVPGDRLWVRETWCHVGSHSGPETGGKSVEDVRYRADGDGCVWRPSIHMPRWASRILLEIKAVRVERLNDISREDSIAEGWDQQWRANEIIDQYRPIIWYGSLWCEINGPGSWDANPWVWVIQFRKIIDKKKGGLV